MPALTLHTGKLPAPLLRELLEAGPGLPAEVLLGPGVGEDACAIRLPAGTLVAATDPITLVGRGAGAHSVWINANDVAVMGVRPRWFLASLLLPEGTTDHGVAELLEGIRSALERVGAALVGGHTEVTSAVTQPVVVGVMLGHAADGRFVATSGARPGDAILQVGPAPVEGAAVLAAEARDRLVGLPQALLDRALGALEAPGISVVEPALLCARLGATALHDPTEGGLSAGLWELAEASGVALAIDPEAVLWYEPGRVVCEMLGADPWGTLASGCLLAALPAERAGAAVGRLREEGYEASRLGRAEPGAGVALHGAARLPRYDRDEVARLLAEAP